MKQIIFTIILLFILISCRASTQLISSQVIEYKTIYLQSNYGPIPLKIPGNMPDFTQFKDILFNPADQYNILCFIRFYISDTEHNQWYDIYVDCKKTVLLVLGHKCEEDKYWIFNSNNKAIPATVEQVGIIISKFYKGKSQTT